MLILGSRLINIPIMSLQTGTRLAFTKRPLIDPSNLKIIAYEVDGPLLSEYPSFIRIADVRELSDIGLIIDSNDELVGLDDVIAIKKIDDLKFNLVGLDVKDEHNQRLGKVEGYSLDTDSFIIQQLYVKRTLIKGITETNLVVHRSQIIEINDQTVIIKSGTKKLESITEPSKLSYINPFRSPSTQTDINSPTVRR